LRLTLLNRNENGPARGHFYFYRPFVSDTQRAIGKNHSATSSGLILDPQGLMYKLTLAGLKIARIR
jgi:hypothetical protein